ncbi:MAG TPA: hypothetical protein DCZ48_14860 [Methylococcaceae bacterium]|nr:hypothetical protein [Methylococcaceae bacterium]
MKRPVQQVLKRIFSILAALLGIGLILWLDSWFMNHSDMPSLSRDMGYGLLFVVGFLTSFHCVGMCGPLIVGYSAKGGIHFTLVTSICCGRLSVPQG